MRRRDWTALALAMGLVLVCARVQAAPAGTGEAGKKSSRVRVEKDVMVPMADGVKLATDIYFPAGLPKAPVILTRTPYGKRGPLGGSLGEGREIAARGYIFVYQDVRGRYGSEGNFYPFTSEEKDGHDTLAWIRKQSWFGGKVATFGASYLGTTQWFPSPGEDLSAMFLIVTSPNLREVVYTGGELHLMTVFTWSALMGERKANLKFALKLSKLNDFFQTLPLSSADDRAGRDVDYFNDALDPLGLWKKYESLNFESRYQEVRAPAVLVAGWYDMFLGPQLKDFNRLLTEGQGHAKDSVLVVGPWGHGQGGDGTVSYGPSADQDKAIGQDQALLWFDYWMKGEKNAAAEWPRVKIFVMGENQWRDEKEWPLARAQYTKYYVHSGGRALTRAGDGTLSLEPPAGNEPADAFAYDPLNPVPTLGGNNLGLSLGAFNQSKVEDRPDVLCYTSPVLSADLEVTGPITATLYAISDAKDTDFTVKLVDVYPDGAPVNIQDGIVRALFRNNDPEHPTPLVPGAVEQYQIDLWATSNLFQAGHRIRVEISSSNFPRFNRNLNTGEPVPSAARGVVAHQSIVHDVQHPSFILLPVIPRP